MESYQAFNSVAKEYDEWYREEPGSVIFESEIKAIDALTLKGVGVEVGVGTGVVASRLNVFLGVDPALRMLKIAKRRGINVVQALGEFLPVKSECLDYALFVFTISFLRDPGSSLREAWRILKKKGNIIIGFVPRNSKWGKLYQKKKAGDHTLYKHANLCVLEEIEKMLEKEGFKTTEISATLNQEPENVRRVEEPSSKLNERGFICIKAVKR